MGSGQSGLTLSGPLSLDYKPVTRVENFCATGSEAVRNACYAVASGAYDRVMAVGVEKLKDSGYSGLVRANPAGDGTEPDITAPAAFSLLDPAYCAKHGVDAGDMREAMTHVAWKNHANGALNPRAQFRREVPKEKIAAAPPVAGRLGVFDCSGVSDGAACALIVRAEEAHEYTDRPMYVKALSFVAGPASGPVDPAYDYTTFPEVVAQRQRCLRPGRGVRPAQRDHDGRGARLLHPHRAGADGGPGLLRARPGLARRAGRGVRDRRTPAGQPRRRAEVASGTRSGPAACACCTRCGCSCAGRRASARWTTLGWD